MLRQSWYGGCILFFFLLFPCLDTLPSHASTLWGAAGDKTTFGGAVLAANHDGSPGDVEIRLVVPKSGFVYLGLFSTKGDKTHGVVAGINEKGLALVSASVDSLPKNIKHAGEKGVTEKILASYDSVDALLRNRPMLLKGRPLFYMVADRTKIAAIEVAPRKEISIKTVDNGVTCHTNHYTDEALAKANKKIDTSSIIRLDRIQHLLSANPGPFTVDDFIVFSEDAVDGPDNSLLRTGGTPKRERTQASWIVSIPGQGAPELYLKIADHKDTGKVHNFLLDTPFWTEGLQ